VKEALAAWQSRGLQVTIAALVVGSLTDPYTIRHPHMRAHGLEGQLFRTVLADALRSGGISSSFLSDRDIYQQAATALGLDAQALRRLVSALRDPDKRGLQTIALLSWALCSLCRQIRLRSLDEYIRQTAGNELLLHRNRPK
jgi:hypothetical protein